ncbi:MAG TPA: circadian clock KaiB family protein [Luteibacter sp.]|uniref:circadian clock KaiB family protein n=1 Tax=Luteibacter sp. TaxID=1886636 RepID=UPI002CFB6E14|nr:circadian clock KaiB family protein [Luteibacter sp.]HVI55981.1 circadian clock KaiB family protein [Luteibacter sp.]
MTSIPTKTDASPTALPHYQLRLFITGSTPRSTRAIENLRRICAENLDGRYELEVIDVYERPETTRELQIVATPTLVKVLPEPLRRIIGDLSDELKVLAGLDLASRPAQRG